VAAVEQSWLDELGDWLSIPSVSADAAHAEDVVRAGEWVCDFVRAAGGEASIVRQGDRPLAVGEIRSSRADAPTVLVYGHFDVQPPAPLDLWESPPFEATIRDGTLYARGAADDKGNLYCILRALADLAREGALPVHVRLACDGEEEIGGHSIVDYLAADERGADACLIYDSMLVGSGRPTFAVATRGLVYVHVKVTTGVSDLHSGLFGGAALNAVHALTEMLSAVLPRDGRLAEPLRAGIAPPTDEERAGWASLSPGASELAQMGARPADGRAAEEFYIRTFAEPALDVNGVEAGSPHLIKTVLPVEAHANVSVRLAPGQEPTVIAAALERLLRESAPPGADVEVELRSSAPPGLVDPHSKPVTLALDAVERVIGTPPLLLRLGGTLPILPALAGNGIPTVLTGYALPDCNAHAPNERMTLENLARGVAAARATLVAWGDL
jgi:acetylornithine deacetylase/succinyl-diaminopimelate desuccinylase-like protein